MSRCLRVVDLAILPAVFPATILFQPACDAPGNLVPDPACDSGVESWTEVAGRLGWREDVGASAPGSLEVVAERRGR